MKLSVTLLLIMAWTACALPQVEQDKSLFRTHDQECSCDPTRPETMGARECSLCREAERQPTDTLYFFLKDTNPRKPNRWLILPRAHAAGMHTLEMSAGDSLIFWRAAIDKARSMWGGAWGLAVNGDRSRTQCHAHVHIGKLVETADAEDYLFKLGGSPVPGKPARVLQDVSQIRVPENGDGFWIHAAGPDLHLHVESPAAASEFVLLR